MANNNDDRILSYPDSESLSSLSCQCTQLSKHHNAPIALCVGGTNTHKRKHGQQPKTEDQKIIIPQLNSKSIQTPEISSTFDNHNNEHSEQHNLKTPLKVIVI